MAHISIGIQAERLGTPAPEVQAPMARGNSAHSYSKKTPLTRCGSAQLQHLTVRRIPSWRRLSLKPWVGCTHSTQKYSQSIISAMDNSRIRAALQSQANLQITIQEASLDMEEARLSVPPADLQK